MRYCDWRSSSWEAVVGLPLSKTSHQSTLLSSAGRVRMLDTKVMVTLAVRTLSRHAQMSCGERNRACIA